MRKKSRIFGRVNFAGSPGERRKRLKKMLKVNLSTGPGSNPTLALVFD
jgi:hypothetical protein